MIFANGLKNPEGPVSLADGSWLVVEGGADRGCTTWVSPDGRTTRVVAKTGRPNGLAVDSEGAIWVAESKFPSLLKVSFDGHVETVATGCDGEPFLFPNDLCFGPDGAIYMTDSGVFIDEFAPNNAVREDFESIDYDGRVYRIEPASGRVTKLDSGIKFTNGIAFDFDKALYVTKRDRRCLPVRVVGRGDSSKREYFGNVVDPFLPKAWRGPDGMAFGLDSRLYVAVFGQGDVTVLDPSGQVVERMKTHGSLPTNIAFAGSGSKASLCDRIRIGHPADL